MSFAQRLESMATPVKSGHIIFVIVPRPGQQKGSFSAKSDKLSAENVPQLSYLSQLL